jgi:hypothetical protein
MRSTRWGRPACRVFEGGYDGHLHAALGAAPKLTRPYGSGTVLPDSKLPQLTVGTPARFAVPVMNEFESQNKSGACPQPVSTNC